MSEFFKYLLKNGNDKFVEDWCNIANLLQSFASIVSPSTKFVTTKRNLKSLTIKDLPSFLTYESPHPRKVLFGDLVNKNLFTLCHLLKVFELDFDIHVEMSYRPLLNKHLSVTLFKQLTTKGYKKEFAYIDFNEHFINVRLVDERWFRVFCIEKNTLTSVTHYISFFPAVKLSSQSDNNKVEITGSKEKTTKLKNLVQSMDINPLALEIDEILMMEYITK